MKPNTPRSALPNWQLCGKRVLVRADLNVPFDTQQRILNTYKLTQVLPTVECIRKKQGIVILATHIGRPTYADPALSTRHLIPWFQQQGYRVKFCATLEEAHECTGSQDELILLENLRFFAGEKERNETFAHNLARLGDYFVQDAFGALHNNDASITLVPQFFAPSNRTIGLLVEKELQALTTFMHNLGDHCLLIIGGNKLASKIPFLHAMLDHVHTIVFLPDFAYPCLQARHPTLHKLRRTQATTGKPADEKLIEACRVFMQEAKRKNVNLVFPRDYYVNKSTVDEPMQKDPVHELGSDDIAIMCGPETITQTDALCNKATAIIVNGLMGFADRPETLKSMHAIVQAVAASHAQSLIGGGDTVAAVEQFGMLKDFTHVSTGGGAMLAFMTGQPLPGLEVL